MEKTFRVSSNMISDPNNISNNYKSMMSSEDILFDEFTNIKSRIRMRGYNEMQQFVKNNILKILTSAIDKRPRALQILTDKEFLVAMDMDNIDLPREYTNRFNRVYRAYIMNPSRNLIYNAESASIMYNVAVKLNKRLTSIIQELGIPENDALMIVINRYSSTDERRNIRRMVRTMQHIDANIMTEQMIVDIFAKTFNDQFSNLFCAIMTDKFDYFENKNEEYVYSTVSNALLDILNSMDIDEIKDILLEYLTEIDKSQTQGRFSLGGINADDYQKIILALDELEDMGIKLG